MTTACPRAPRVEKTEDLEKMLYMCGICCVPYRLSKILCPNPFPKNEQTVKLTNADLDLIRRIHIACGFHGFTILFWIWPKKRSVK